MAKIYENYVQNIPKDVARWLGYDAIGPKTSNKVGKNAIFQYWATDEG